MELTLAEELLLLALHDEKGSTGFTNVHPGLAGALLVDLGVLGAVRPAGKELEPVTGVDIAHPVLARAHAEIAGSEKRRSAKSWVGRLPSALKPITETVATPLVQRGVLDEHRKKFLGLLPDTRFREADPGPERALRARLRQVLLGAQPAAERDALLIGLLVPLDLHGDLVESEHRKDAKKRAKEIAENGVAGTAVGDAVKEIQAAVMVAVLVPVVTGGGGG